MGSGCSSMSETLAGVVSSDDLHHAVRSIETWEQARALESFKAVPLLKRMGGPAALEKVVELFYRKLYANNRLRQFLRDKDIALLRSKQAMFMNWLFGPPSVPYSGRNPRCAHLRLIKQRGFTEDDFLLGMQYFEDSMREYGAPQRLIDDVQSKLMPFKDVIFTPAAVEALEESRWAAEDAEGAQQLQSAYNAIGPAAVPERQVSLQRNSLPITARATLCPFAGTALSLPSSGHPSAGAAAASLQAAPHAVIIDDEASPFMAGSQVPSAAAIATGNDSDLQLPLSASEPSRAVAMAAGMGASSISARLLPPPTHLLVRRRSSAASSDAYTGGGGSLLSRSSWSSRASGRSKLMVSAAASAVDCGFPEDDGVDDCDLGGSSGLPPV